MPGAPPPAGAASPRAAVGTTRTVGSAPGRPAPGATQVLPLADGLPLAVGFGGPGVAAPKLGFAEPPPGAAPSKGTTQVMPFQGAPPPAARGFAWELWRQQLQAKGAAFGVCVVIAPFVLLQVWVYSEIWRNYVDRGGAAEESVGIDELVEGLDGEHKWAFAVYAAVLSDMGTVGVAVWLWMMCRELAPDGGPRWTRGMTATFSTQMLTFATLAVLRVPSLILFNALLHIVVSALAPWLAERHLPKRPLWGHTLRRILGVQVFAATFTAVIWPAFAAAGDAGRLVVRLLVYPAISEMWLSQVRHMGRAYAVQGATDACITSAVAPAVGVALAGRLMVLPMQSAGATVALYVGAPLVELFMRLTVSRRDALYLTLVRRSRASARAEMATPEAEYVRADMLAFQEVGEDAGVVLAAMITLLWRVSLDGRAPSAWAVLLSAGAQLVLEGLSDSLPAVAAHAMLRRNPDEQNHGRLERAAARLQRRRRLAYARFSRRFSQRPLLAMAVITLVPTLVGVVGAALLPGASFCGLGEGASGWFPVAYKWAECSN